MDEQLYLTLEQFLQVKSIFIDSFDTEIKRLAPDDKAAVVNKLIYNLGVLKFHTLFRDDVIQMVVNTIFEGSALTDFILCLTDRFSILTGVEEYRGNKIAITVANCFGDEKPLLETYSPNSFIPEKILANISIDRDAAVEAFISNRFYLIVALIILFINDTDVIQKELTPNKR